MSLGQRPRSHGSFEFLQSVWGYPSRSPIYHFQFLSRSCYVDTSTCFICWTNTHIYLYLVLITSPVSCQNYSFCNNYLPTKIVFLLGYHDVTFTSRLSSLALSSVNIPTVGGARWSTPMVPAQLSVPLQQMEEWAPKPVEWTICFLTASGLACTLMIVLYECMYR